MPFYVVTGASCGINSDRVIVGRSSSESLPVSSDSYPSPNEIFLEEKYCEGSRFIVYFAREYPLWGSGGT